MLEKVNRYSIMYDFYGPLLTARQQEFFELYYHQDWSLGEIADYFQISRAAVHDLLKRVEKQLDNYERKLQLVDKFSKINGQLEKLQGLVALLAEATGSKAEWQKVQQVIEQLISLTRE